MNIKPKTYTKQVLFKITPEDYEILKAITEEENTSSSELFRTFIREKQREIEWVKFDRNENQAQLF